MSSLLSRLRDLVAGSDPADPSARRLRGDAFLAFLKTKTTAEALAIVPADARVLADFRSRGEAAKAAILARLETAARAALDEGRPAAERRPDEEEPENVALVDALEAVAAELGLQGRGQVEAHLTDRRRVLVDHLAGRYASEGPPAVLVELRKALSALVVAGWELSRALDEARKRYRGLGGAGNPDPAVERSVVEAATALNANANAQDAIRRRLTLEFLVER